MNSEKKIKSFALLGEEILEIVETEADIIHKAYLKNAWFVPTFIKDALSSISFMLEEKKLSNWLSNYPVLNKGNKDIGIVMAGNIPMVGFHDLLTVILSGNRAIIKLSQNDDVLMPHIASLLESIDPEIIKQIVYKESLDGVDAVIATGSDNTARYFKFTYKDIPHIIRKNRTSCSILDGNETARDFEGLSKDVFSYFGLGCRNVSKIFIPKDFDITELIRYFNNFSWIQDHPKYYNNYKYQYAKSTVERISFFDGQFFILFNNNNLVSPIACLYYEEYQNLDMLKLVIKQNNSKLQCIVSKTGWFENSLPFGMAQYPEPWEYADNVDTMSFLLRL